MIQHKNPVEESFIMWITMNPDSFHHLDMKRFYVFVHSVIRYNAKSWYSFKKFKEQILFHKPNFPEDTIEYYYNLMQQLINFSKESYFPLYNYDDNSEITVRTVEKGKIVIKASDKE
jgi:hypothetical protein